MMMTTDYNPYMAAVNALTCKDAQRFYVRTAFDHMDLTIEAGRNCYLAGQAVREWHDQCVPYALMAIAAITQWFIRSNDGAVDDQQALLRGIEPIGLLMPCDEQLAVDEHQEAGCDDQPIRDEGQEVEYKETTFDKEFCVRVIAQLGEVEIRRMAMCYGITGWSRKRLGTLVLEMEDHLIRDGVIVELGQ